MRRVPLTRPYFDSDELHEVKKVLDSGWVSQGPRVEEFEDAVARYLGAKYVICVANCTSALHLALLSAGVGKGDDVLVADYTFPATAHAVLHCGARPIFVDVDATTYNINPTLIEKMITKRTKAIMPVHTFGQPAEMDRVADIAKRHGLAVIEDAACALGAKYKDRFAGTIGDIGCFSLHGRKGITTGEGGFLATGSRRLAERIRRLSVFGMSVPKTGRRGFIIPKFTDVGYNYKMSDITAAIGLAQLRKLETIIDRKRALAAHWTERLSDIDGIAVPYTNSKVRHIYQSYIVLTEEGVDRDRMIMRLAKRGIQTQIGTYACHIQPVYRSKYKCPNSLKIFKRAMALPIYYELSKRDINRMAEIIKDTLEGLM